jgi:hypothetical protein
MYKMSDSIIYDMAEQTQGAPSICLKKDWLSILDNQTNSYAGSQCVIETSALANNNKYLNPIQAITIILNFKDRKNLSTDLES